MANKIYIDSSRALAGLRAIVKGDAQAGLVKGWSTQDGTGPVFGYWIGFPDSQAAIKITTIADLNQVVSLDLGLTTGNGDDNETAVVGDLTIGIISGTFTKSASPEVLTGVGGERKPMDPDTLATGLPTAEPFVVPIHEQSA
jgi:hypothetical protein